MSFDFKYGGRDASLIKYLEDRVGSDPTSCFFAMLAFHYIQDGRIEEALSIAREGVAAHPGYSTGYAVLSMSLYRSGLLAEAREALASAAALRPDSSLVESYRVLFQEAEASTKTVETTEAAEAQNSPAVDAEIEIQMKSPEEIRRGAEKDSQTEPLTSDDVKSNIEEDIQSPGGGGDSLDFDAIARELDSAGPIRPPVGSSQEGSSGEGIELTQDIVTDTLASILEQQGKYDSAIRAYKMLAEKKPENAGYYRQKISDLSSRADAYR